MPLSPHPRFHCDRSGLKKLVLLALFLSAAVAPAQERSLELSRTDRPWEFLTAVGTRAGVFGDESGKVEAWVYPLKLFRNFHVQFEVGGRILPAESLARTVTAKPESCSIIYAGDTFTVKETFFVPVQEPGAVITFEITTENPLNIRVAFDRDFQLEWPAALGATYANWDASLHAFTFGEEQKKYSAVVGSPTATNEHLEYQDNYSSSNEDSFDLGVTAKKTENRVVILSASVHGATEAQKTYQQLTSDYAQLLSEAAAYYRSYLARTVSVELPDTQLQQAYDWSRISVLQGFVNNPFLGTGMIAGYRTSGTSQRPGFAWFFGRDSMWTALALDAEGDFSTTRTALEFLSKFQRDDGKIPHEIAQTASLVDWFKGYPYAFASADATPLYIIAMNDYANESGDLEFVRGKWDGLWKAYQFLHSTYDSQGLPQNFGIGHGWVEGGPLLPVRGELYQSAVGAAALHSLANIAHLIGKQEEEPKPTQESEDLEKLINKIFWLADKKRYAFALDQSGKPVDEPSVLATVPMWFGLLREEQAQPMISELAAPEHQADWGLRIIANTASRYSGGGYHYGSVWPLFTGWASVGEYQYHRDLPAYGNLRANALLALDGSLGHVTEVLSGDQYQPLSTSSPHQIWSAAMVISPLLRGMFGLSSDAINHVLTFAPHVPADWPSLAVKNVHVGACVVDLHYHRTEEAISLDADRSGTGDCSLEFSPSLALGAEVIQVEINGHLIANRVTKSPADQHLNVKFPLAKGSNKLHITVLNDFGISIPTSLPALGTKSRGLRVLSETWSAAHDRLELDVAGAKGTVYDLGLWSAGQLSLVEGADWTKGAAGRGQVHLHMPAGDADEYARAKIIFHFTAKSSTEHIKGN